MAHETREQAINKLNQLIKGIRVAMLTTVDEDGELHSRPMATQKAETRDGVLWFFTSANSQKVEELQHDHHVNLGYASPDDNRYVSVSGAARLMRDRQKIEELWSPVLKAWFPQGVDTPDIALLRVEVHSAEYWDSPSSTMVKLAGFTKAVLHGERYEPGENERIDLGEPVTH